MSIPLPYMIGMAMVGLFAVFVLVFDAMLCVKKKGFMYTIKHSCCGKSRDKNDNKGQSMTLLFTAELKYPAVLYNDGMNI